MKIKRTVFVVLITLFTSLFQGLPTANAAGPATQLVLTRPAAGPASGSAFTTQPQLTLQDASGVTVTGSALIVSVSFGGRMSTHYDAEKLIGTLTATIDSATGVATFPSDFGITGIAGRTYTLTFSASSMTSATQNITVTPGVASRLAIKKASAGTTSGVAFTTQPQISVADSSYNPVSGFASVVNVAISAGGTLVGSTSATVDTSSGIATFNNLGVSGTIGTTYTLTYSASGLTSTTSTVKIGTPTVPGFPNYGGNSSTTTVSLLEYNFPAPDNGGSDITSYEYQWVTASSSAAATPTGTWITYPAPEIQAGLVILSIDLSLLVRAVDPNYNYFLLRTVNAIGPSSHTTTGYRLGFLGVPVRDIRSAPISGTTLVSGATLSNQMTFSGPTPITYSYEWQSCTTISTSSCTNIAGATSSTYALTDADVGKYIRNRAIATNSYGSSATGSASFSLLTTVVGANSGPDITAPTVTSINSTTTNSTYKAGEVISIQVNFSENVTVTGTPKLTLETGSADRAISYASGTGTNQLTFTYTVQAGDTTADLDYLSTSALDLNGGTIRDAAANNAVLTLAAPGATNSLGANKAIVIDTTAPTQTITNIDISADTGSSATDFNTATASQTITGTLSASLAAGESLWGSIDGGANYVNITSSVSGTAISWPSVTLSGSNSIAFQLRDLVGNVGGAITQAYELDTTAPTQTITNIDISADTGSSATDFITATTTQTITGTLSANLGANESLWGSVNGGTNYVNISSSVTGTAISWANATLVSGSSSIKFQVRDLAGNAGAEATQIYELNTNAPTQTITNIDISADTGSSATDFITATASQTITGTLSANLGAGDSLWASVDGGANYTNITSSVSGSAISWLNVTLNGSSSIKFQVRDNAGASGVTATQAYVLDSTAPVPTVATVVVISPTAVAVRSSEIGTAYLVKTTVTVSNLASITGAADDSMNQVAIAAADTDTTMSTAGLIPGDYKLYVVDAAGNLSLASNNIVTVAAATAPTATSTSAPTGTTTVGSTLTNAVTFIGLPVPTLSYQWKICTNATETATVCSDISGATGSTFIANAIDLVGKFIRVLVTAVNGVSPDAIEWSSPTAAIVAVVPPAPAPVVPPAPICDAACVAEQNAIIAKIIADRIAAEAKVVSDAAAKVVAEKVVVDKAAAVAAAKAAVEKAATAVLAKAAADTAALEATAVAKAAADAQIAAADAASKASAVLKSATTTAAAKAAATANATKAATTAANAVNLAAVAARRAAVARATAANASKQVEIALGALASKTAAATNVAQANAIAAAAKAAANAAAKAAADQALTARAASNNANNEATIAVERVATKQTEAATAAVEAKIAADAALNATNEKISAAAEAQRSAEAVVKALEEKIVLAEAAVNAKDVTERAAIEKKIEEATAKVAEAQRIADAANTRSEAAVVALERAQTAATLATQKAQLQAAEMVAVRAESTAKTVIATTAAETASLAAKVAAAAKAAAAKIPARAAISARPGTTSKNSARATITGLKPGQKVKVTVNVKGK